MSSSFFCVCICLLGSHWISPFIASQMTTHLSFESLLCPLKRGWYPCDGTWRCLSVLACVAFPGAFMTLCVYPHVGYYQAGHLTVLLLMPSTTHLMGIKCEDLLNLFSRPARHNNPSLHSLDPCRPYLDKWRSKGLLVSTQFFPSQELYCQVPLQNNRTLQVHDKHFYLLTAMNLYQASGPSWRNLEPEYSWPVYFG